MTHRWGSADEDAIRRRLRRRRRPQRRASWKRTPPTTTTSSAVMEANPADPRTARRAACRTSPSAPWSARSTTTSKKALTTSIDYTAWPLVEHTLAARRVFGKAPRYVIGMSSEGADTMHAHYDFDRRRPSRCSRRCAATCTTGCATKAHGQRRAHALRRTESLAGRHVRRGVRAVRPPVRARRALSEPEEVAEAIVGICSGLIDALGGQVLTVDRGAACSRISAGCISERDVHPLMTRRNRMNS